MRKAEGLWGVVYKVGKVMQVWVGKGGFFGGVVVQAEALGEKVYRVGEVMRCALPHRARYIAGWGPSRLEVGGRLGQGCPRQAPIDGVAPHRRHGRDRGRGR